MAQLAYKQLRTNLTRSLQRQLEAGARETANQTRRTLPGLIEQIPLHCCARFLPLAIASRLLKKLRTIHAHHTMRHEKKTVRSCCFVRCVGIVLFSWRKSHPFSAACQAQSVVHNSTCVSAQTINKNSLKFPSLDSKLSSKWLPSHRYGQRSGRSQARPLHSTGSSPD